MVVYNIDEDVATLCLEVLPTDGQLISIADFMESVQKMKNKLIKTLSTSGKPKELKSSSKKDCSDSLVGYCGWKKDTCKYKVHCETQ